MDGVADDQDRRYSKNQGDKQKISDRMLSWHMNYGRGEGTLPKYDKEVYHNHIPLLTNGMDVSF